MSFLRRFIIFVTIFLSFTVGAFAADDEKGIQKTINNYILEVYKFQGNKIISDLDDNLSKSTTTKEEKNDAYTSIQETLRLKKKTIENDQKM